MAPQTAAGSQTDPVGPTAQLHSNGNAARVPRKHGTGAGTVGHTVGDAACITGRRLPAAHPP
eukprot:740568-Alexandrium_andersonii.AAC.1